MTYQDALAGRCSLEGQIYHVTICTRHRYPFFHSYWAGRQVVNTLRHLEGQQLTHSMAWVLMPDHLHWLFQLNHSASLSGVVHAFKGRSARKVNLYLGRRGGCWQKGFHDHAIRREEDLQQVARYIVANPLRAGLVKRLGDYPLWDAVWL